MERLKRGEYRVIKDFACAIHAPLSNELTHYQVGRIVRLRIHGKMAKDWLEKGYIQFIRTIE